KARALEAPTHRGDESVSLNRKREVGKFSWRCLSVATEGAAALLTFESSLFPLKASALKSPTQREHESVLLSRKMEGGKFSWGCLCVATEGAAAVLTFESSLFPLKASAIEAPTHRGHESVLLNRKMEVGKFFWGCLCVATEGAAALLTFESSLFPLKA